MSLRVVRTFATVASATIRRAAAHRHARTVLAVLGLLAISGVADLRGLPRQEYATDEAMWIDVSIRTWEVLRDGRWDDPLWKDIHATWGHVNPPVAKYGMGLALELQGKRWAWRMGERPPDDVLVAARRASALLGVVGVLGLFVIARLVMAPAAAWLAAIALAIHPVWIEVSRRAMTDVYAAALSILAVACVLPALGALRPGIPPPSAFGWAALAGAVSGLAVAAKLNAASTPVLLAVLLLATGVRRGARAASLAAILAVFASAGAATFVGVNPYLHHEPWSRFRGILAFWTEMCRSQVARGSGFLPEEQGLRHLTARFLVPTRPVSWLLVLSLVPAVVARWMPRASASIAASVARLALPLAALAASPGANQLFHGWTSWFGVLAALLGLSLPAPTRSATARGIPFVALWAGVVACFVWRMTCFPVPRYYLPLVPPICLLSGWGLAEVRAHAAAAGTTARRMFDLAVALGILAVLGAAPDPRLAWARRILAEAPEPARALQIASCVALVAATAMSARTHPRGRDGHVSPATRPWPAPTGMEERRPRA